MQNKVWIELPELVELGWKKDMRELLYHKQINSYQGVDFWIKPKEMFYDEHSSGVPRFKLVESLSEDEIKKYIDKYAEYKKYEVARHSESLEYYVVDLVNEDLVMKI